MNGPEARSFRQRILVMSGSAHLLSPLNPERKKGRADARKRTAERPIGLPVGSAYVVAAMPCV